MSLQGELFQSDRGDLRRKVVAFLVVLLNGPSRPAARELLRAIEQNVGLEGRWEVAPAISVLVADSAFRRDDREYLQTMIEDGSLASAMRGEGAADREVASTVDTLLRQSAVYRSSQAFRDMVQFMGRFRDYAPYNNMLVRVQNPSCGFYATEKDWRERFNRSVKEDARPMLILAPMHPVMTVYDLDQTEGAPLPDEIRTFARFKGDWDHSHLGRLIENAKRHRIKVQFKSLSSTHGGFATRHRDEGQVKMRIVIHADLDPSSRFGVLCHELAHIFLGHLGTDKDRWWPGRANLDRATVEIEAETVAFIVTTRFGLQGSSAVYLARYANGSALPQSVSVDYIAKAASLIERMAKELLPARKPRPEKLPKGGYQQAGAAA